MNRSLLFLLLVVCTPFLRAADKPASEASIREMLRITQSDKMADGMVGQIGEMVKRSVLQSVGRELTVEEQKAADVHMVKLRGLIEAEINWAKLEPIAVGIYQKAFTQAEVDGMIAFYKTPAGQAAILKTPAVMQQSMLAMQGRMASLSQPIQQAVQAVVAEVRANAAKSGAK